MTGRKKHHHQQALSHKEKTASRISTGLIISIVAAVILGGIPFAVGKHIELNSPGPFDSGAFTYSAKHLLEGAKMGVDERPSARPGTLIMNIVGVKLFGFNDIGPKVVQMLLQLAGLVFLFLTMRKVFGSTAAVVGVAIAGVYLSAPLIAKFGNVKEQFMIAFMIYTACSFLWYELTNKKLWLVPAGFFAFQPYYFKPTGMSVVFAIILYLLISRAASKQWKLLWSELLVFLCGYTLGVVIPGSLYLWQNILPQFLRSFPPLTIALGAGVLILTAIPLGLDTLAEKKGIDAIKKIPQWAWAVGFAAILIIVIITQGNRILAAAGLKGGGYLAYSLAARGLSKLAPQVFRYYKALSVPVLTALCSIIAAAVVWLQARLKKQSLSDIQSKVVWMLAIWWILDMAFIWVSPRSYEQYYLPMCGSAAVLSGYAVWKWQKRLMRSQNKLPSLGGGIVAAIILGCLSIPIFIGQRYSPDTGMDYLENPRYKQRQRGFGPSLKELDYRKKNSWIAAGDYIRKHSSEDDTIYVWGWYPGIYVQAQRLAPVPKAFESNMHVTPPDTLVRQIKSMVDTMEKNPPKFIVDTRKIHFPNDRPPLELWPIVPNRYLGNEKPRLLRNDPREIALYDAKYKKNLENQIEPDEALRYEAMKPFRNFVMNHYKIAGQFGNHFVFERID